MKHAYLCPVLDLSLPPPNDPESVRRLAQGVQQALQLLESEPAHRLEVALAGAVTQALLRYGEERVLQMLAERASAGQVSFLATACWGAFLPLVPPEEARRQLDLNEAANRESLGDWVYRADGLFPPQLGYSRSVAHLAAERGLTRVLVDSLGYRGGAPLPRMRHFVLEGNPGFHLFFADRALSERLVRGELGDLGRLRRAIAPAGPGHVVLRIPARALVDEAPGLQLLAALDPRGEVRPAGLEELLALFPEVEAVEPLPCALGTELSELAAGIQFAKWSAPGNELQALLWRLAEIAVEQTCRLERAPEPMVRLGASQARALLDISLDCASWRFASGKPELDPEKVSQGCARLLAVIRAGGAAVDARAALEAERLAARVHQRCAELARESRMDVEGAVESGGAGPA